MRPLLLPSWMALSHFLPSSDASHISTNCALLKVLSTWHSHRIPTLRLRRQVPNHHSLRRPSLYLLTPHEPTFVPTVSGRVTLSSFASPRGGRWKASHPLTP